MRLSEFILSNLDEILKEWESFARTILPAKNLDKLALIDHAPEILKTIALDMEGDGLRTGPEIGGARGSDRA